MLLSRGGMGVVYCDAVDDLIHEVQNARVWGGIHYRNSTLVGARLGDEVARWDLHHGPF